MSSPQSNSDQKTVTSRTAATVLTGLGRSAIAVISVAGDQAASAVDQYFRRATPSPMHPGQIRYGTWSSSQNQASQNQASGESIVVTPIDVDQFEIHCHGGQAAIDVILSDLQVVGVEIATEPHPMTTKPLLIREAESVLIECTTAQNAAIAMEQVRGSMNQWAEDALTNARQNRETIIEQARGILTYAALTTHLTQPYRIVLVGAPNVGKSSLTNAILGYNRSITMNTAGTTRDVLHAETVIGGIPIRISDTAGIRQHTGTEQDTVVEQDTGVEQADEIEKEGIRRAIQEIETADLVIRVRDPETDFAAIPGHIKSIDVTNKSDLIADGNIINSDISGILVSATSGDGVEMLLGTIKNQLVQHRPPAGSPAAINQRQVEALQRISNAGDDMSVIEAVSALIGKATD